jgi:hypothetical protein
MHHHASSSSCIIIIMHHHHHRHASAARWAHRGPGARAMPLHMVPGLHGGAGRRTCTSRREACAGPLSCNTAVRNTFNLLAMTSGKPQHGGSKALCSGL